MILTFFVDDTNHEWVDQFIVYVTNTTFTVPHDQAINDPAFKVCANFPGGTEWQPTTIYCQPEPILGRFVFIHSPHLMSVVGAVSICELEIYGI